MKALLPAVVAIALAGCIQAPPPRPTPPPVAGPELLVRVSIACELPDNALSGVTVTAVTDEGKELKLGTTFGGLIRLQKETLRQNRANLLLFCLPPYFRCVALRVADDNLYAFDEYYVDLPKIVLR